MQEMQVQSLGQEDPLAKGMATHSSILAWTIPMDREAWGATVHGILQAKILQWVAMPSSRGSSHPRDGTRVSYISYIGSWQADSLLLAPPVYENIYLREIKLREARCGRW